MSQRITIGFGTILGTIGALAGVLIPILGQLADAAEPLGVPGSVWVIASAILATAVVIGRMGQAMAQTMAGVPAIDDADPALLVDEEPVEPTDVPPR
jgi:hypothetical protein